MATASVQSEEITLIIAGKQRARREQPTGKTKSHPKGHNNEPFMVYHTWQQSCGLLVQEDGMLASIPQL